jgi:membrane fusion protein (multidrug efflux system)
VRHVVRRFVWGLALVVIAAAGALYWFRDHPRLAAYVPAPVWALLPADDNAKAQPPAAAAPPRAAPPVETAMVEVGRVADEVEALGTLAANESVVIAPEIAGRVTRLGFKEGEAVKEGQELVVLDATILENEVKQAQANLDLAKDTYERARSLAQRGTGTQVALEQATATLAANEASIALARARLEKATIVAPFDGVVGLRSVGVGDFVAVGTNLITLTDIDPIKIDFRVPEIFLGQVRDGQTIEIRVDAIPDRTFTGQIYVIDPVVDVNGRAIRLRARAPNPDGALKPGLFARVTIVTDAREDALMVPEAAVMPAGTGKAVYVVDNGNARLTKVEIGKRLAGKVEITEGLKAGDRVVIAGQMRLRDGAPVDVVSADRLQTELTR